MMREYSLRSRKRKRRQHQQPDPSGDVIQTRDSLWRDLRSSRRVQRRWPLDLLRLVVSYTPCLRDKLVSRVDLAGYCVDATVRRVAVIGAWETDDPNVFVLFVTLMTSWYSREFWSADLSAGRIKHRWSCPDSENFVLERRGPPIRDDELVTCACSKLRIDHMVVVRIHLDARSSVAGWSVVLELPERFCADALQSTLDPGRRCVWVLCRGSLMRFQLDGSASPVRTSLPAEYREFFAPSKWSHFFVIGNLGTLFGSYRSWSGDQRVEVFALVPSLSVVARLPPGSEVHGVDEEIGVVYYTRVAARTTRLEAAALHADTDGESPVVQRSATPQCSMGLVASTSGRLILFGKAAAPPEAISLLVYGSD